MNFYYDNVYANKMAPYWLSQLIPDLYRPDPADFPNQETGLYHNYETEYQDHFNPQTENWREEYLNKYQDVENYTTYVNYSDEGEWEGEMSD